LLKNKKDKNTNDNKYKRERKDNDKYKYEVDYESTSFICVDFITSFTDEKLHSEDLYILKDDNKKAEGKINRNDRKKSEDINGTKESKSGSQDIIKFMVKKGEESYDEMGSPCHEKNYIRRNGKEKKVKE